MLFFGMSGKDKARVEEEMRVWLAHPAEFGVEPRGVRYRKTVKTRLAGTSGRLDVHVVDYEMPDGTRGKGFVNPITWSFIGDLPYDRLTDEQLVTAYTGWAFLFSAQQSGVSSEFEPQTWGEVCRALAIEGVFSPALREKYAVGTSELFEFEGVRNGRPVVGAGDVSLRVVADRDDPQASLPMIYTFLGRFQRGEL